MRIARQSTKRKSIKRKAGDEKDAVPRLCKRQARGSSRPPAEVEDDDDEEQDHDHDEHDEEDKDDDEDQPEKEESMAENHEGDDTNVEMKKQDGGAMEQRYSDAAAATKEEAMKAADAEVIVGRTNLNRRLMTAKKTLRSLNKTNDEALEWLKSISVDDLFVLMWNRDTARTAFIGLVLFGRANAFQPCNLFHTQFRAFLLECAKTDDGIAPLVMSVLKSFFGFKTISRSTNDHYDLSTRTFQIDGDHFHDAVSTTACALFPHLYESGDHDNDEAWKACGLQGKHARRIWRAFVNIQYRGERKFVAAMRRKRHTVYDRPVEAMLTLRWPQGECPRWIRFRNALRIRVGPPTDIVPKLICEYASWMICIRDCFEPTSNVYSETLRKDHIDCRLQQSIFHREYSKCPYQWDASAVDPQALVSIERQTAMLAMSNRTYDYPTTGPSAVLKDDGGHNHKNPRLCECRLSGIEYTQCCFCVVKDYVLEWPFALRRKKPRITVSIRRLARPFEGRYLTDEIVI